MILSQTYCTEQAGLRRRVTILRVMVEPRGSGMALFTLRAAEEVQSPQFGSAEGDLDVEMVAIARSIVRQRMGTFKPLSACLFSPKTLIKIRLKRNTTGHLLVFGEKRQALSGFRGRAAR